MYKNTVFYSQCFCFHGPASFSQLGSEPCVAPRARKHISSPVGVSILELEEALETILTSTPSRWDLRRRLRTGLVEGFSPHLWQSQSDDLICQFMQWESPTYKPSGCGLSKITKVPLYTNTVQDLKCKILSYT